MTIGAPLRPSPQQAKEYFRPQGGPLLATPPLPNAIIRFQDFRGGDTSVGPAPATFGGSVVTPGWITYYSGGTPGTDQWIGLNAPFDTGAARLPHFGTLALSQTVNGGLVHVWEGVIANTGEPPSLGGMWDFRGQESASKGIAAIRVLFTSAGAANWGLGYTEAVDFTVGTAGKVGFDWVTDPETPVTRFAGTSALLVHRNSQSAVDAYVNGVLTVGAYAAGDVTCRFYADVATNSHSCLLIAAADFTTGWYTFEFAFDGVDMKIYVNRVLMGTWANAVGKFSFHSFINSFGFLNRSGTRKTFYIDCIYEEIGLRDLR